MTAQGHRFHLDAMEKMDEHDLLIRTDRSAARLVALEALRLERLAVREGLSEPLRSLVLRSAASIALESGLQSEALAFVGEALSHDDVPTLVASQLRAIAREASRASEASAMGAQSWHRVRVFAAHGRELLVEAASSALAAWVAFLSAAITARMPTKRRPAIEFRPALVTHGSFVVTMDVAAGDLEQELLVATLASLRKGLQQSTGPAPGDGRLWLDVLAVLDDAKLGLDALLLLPGADPISFAIDVEDVGAHRDRLEAASQRVLFSSEVPQADEIRRVFKLLERVGETGGRPEAEELGLDPRQVNYYRHAAEVLRFLGPNWTMTSAGHQLLRLSSDERLAFTAVAFEGTRVARSWIEWSEGRTLLDVDPESAKAFLEDTVTDLSGSTPGRRAKTLAAWHRALAKHHYATKE